MKKIFLQITSIILLLVSCSNDESNENTRETSIIDSLSIESIDYSKDGGSSFTSFLYDTNGRLEKKIDVDGNLAYQNFYLSTNDPVNTTEYYTADGSVSSIQNYEYNEEEKLIKITRLENGVITSESRYERNNNENTIEIYFSVYLTKYYLNSSNQVIRTEISVLSNGQYFLSTSIIPSYDSLGNITKIVNKSQESTIISNFSYDNKTNPFQIGNRDFLSVDDKIDAEIRINNPLTTLFSVNNHNKQVLELNQANGTNNLSEISRTIEYNQDNYPIKISETSGQEASISNFITIINYY